MNAVMKYLKWYYKSDVAFLYHFLLQTVEVLLGFLLLIVSSLLSKDILVGRKLFTFAKALEPPNPPGMTTASNFPSFTASSVSSAQMLTSRLHLTHLLSVILAIVTTTY